MSESSGSTIAVWPTTLPLPFVDAEGQPLHQTLASGLEQANILRRSRFFASVVSLQVRWVFSVAEYEEFKTFFLEELYDGAALFVLELRYPFNSELTEWRVRISGGFAATHQDGIWTVETAIDLISRESDAAPAPAPVIGWEPFYVVTDESSGGDDELFITADGYDYHVKV